MSVGSWPVLRLGVLGPGVGRTAGRSGRPV